MTIEEEKDTKDLVFFSAPSKHICNISSCYMNLLAILIIYNTVNITWGCFMAVEKYSLKRLNVFEMKDMIKLWNPLIAVI